MNKTLEHSAILQKKTFSSVFMSWKRDIRRNYELYIISLLPLAVLIIFFYGPMYGVQIAFKDYVISKGIWGSEWVGFEHFQRLFNGYNFSRILKNTVVLSLYSLFAGFPFPILFAILINEIRNRTMKKTLQMVSYAPYFISTVLLVGMIGVFFDRGNGLVNVLISKFGGEKIAFLAEPKMFKHLYVWSGIWNGLGWSSIIYISALAGVDPQLTEAATIDGANRLQKIWHVDIPAILPTIVITLILNVGRTLSLGFDKAFLMQNDVNLEASEIISTYVYKVGMQNSEYSFASAVGLFNSGINLLLLFIANSVAKRISDTSLW